MHALLLSTLLLANATAATPVERVEIGNRVSENIPAIPPELLEQLNRYQNTRSAAFCALSFSRLSVSSR